MGFKVGTVMNVDNALKMMLVKSANDIAVAIAETVGGNEAKFVASMNAEAQRLGMASTHYNNPNGLPDNGAGDDGARPRRSGASAMGRFPCSIATTSASRPSRPESASCARRTSCSSNIAARPA